MEQVEIESLRDVLKSIVVCDGPSYARDDIAIEVSADAIDQVSAAARREVAAHQLNLSARRLGDAMAALRRIQEGTYGMCLGCDSPISAKRLKAVPWTRYCVTCQESVDQEESGVDLPQRLLG